MRDLERITWWQGLLVTSTVATAAVTVWSAFKASKAVAEALKSLSPPPYKVSGPLVSLIVPTLDEQDYLPLLLASIQNQTYKPIEVIVADSSTDSTPEIARAFGATVVRVEELNVSLARNMGAAAAEGDILIFCDADCIMAPDYVERMARLLQDGAVLGHGSDCVYDSEFNNLLIAPWKWLKPALWTTGRGVAIKRVDFSHAGGYDVECDPTKGCREDLALGEAVLRTFGLGSVVRDRDALVATSGRRPIRLGGVWRERGWRDNVIPAGAKEQTRV